MGELLYLIFFGWNEASYQIKNVYIYHYMGFHHHCLAPLLADTNNLIPLSKVNNIYENLKTTCQALKLLMLNISIAFRKPTLNGAL